LAFVFAFAEAFVDLEAGFFGVGDGEGLEFVGGGEAGDDFADGLFAGGAFLQGRGAEGAVEGEGAAAHFAASFAEFVFVERHNLSG
jgi:hypothetical protein